MNFLYASQTSELQNSYRNDLSSEYAVKMYVQYQQIYLRISNKLYIFKISNMNRKLWCLYFCRRACSHSQKYSTVSHNWITIFEVMRIYRISLSHITYRGLSFAIYEFKAIGTNWELNELLSYVGFYSLFNVMIMIIRNL